MNKIKLKIYVNGKFSKGTSLYEDSVLLNELTDKTAGFKTIENKNSVIVHVSDKIMEKAIIEKAKILKVQKSRSGSVR